MAISHFHLVRRILREGFYIDISRIEIERCVYTNGEFDQEFEVRVDDDGKEVFVVVRVVVHRGQKAKLETFSTAVLIHDIRVAGIDFEMRFKDLDGTKRRGWHFHEWDHTANSAEYRKIPLEGFDFSDLNDFLILAMQRLGITLSGRDDGAPGLQFD
jgi:hypothetical protein